ncbi:hypothetical protein CFOL_v3_05196 [Cephalotus follicularis]|uniref:Uncharacterized protein n=1 Tax=Cephalotus follicularis TaxID=3775 RepID=A0A1Q3B123_CEPFO|nr:hypothetical protein CFOL_v3_05196 [Cephalotus follicularis]
MKKEKEPTRLARIVGSGEFISGEGFNQESSLKRVRHTYWRSHYGALMNLMLLISD